ncbi:hypothetical protein [Geotalea toluenoxydans]|uniref:hypothetical protein n=1 Tax=Geotalea toluenoxydans TaxID=421624 RepID=UPI000AF30FFA|nr:hypothetical protein [Geotalea toluenoxydans]
MNAAANTAKIVLEGVEKRFRSARGDMQTALTQVDLQIAPANSSAWSAPAAAARQRSSTSWRVLSALRAAW